VKPGLPLIAGLLLTSIAYATNRDSISMNKPVPGGWSSAAIDDARVKIAAQRAVAAQASIDGMELKLVSIDGAQQQVVAGMNYKLRLSVAKGNQRRLANATVWAKPNGSYELTGWSWE
jgi:hypothetical protein